MSNIVLPSKKTICVDGSQVCSPCELIKAIQKKVCGGHDDARFKAIDVLSMPAKKGTNIVYEDIICDEPEDTVKALEELKDHFGCDTEKCVLEKAHKQGLITRKEAFHVIDTNIKPSGPIDNSWFDNVNIYSLLTRWAHLYKDFYAFDYAMINFQDYPEEYELARIMPSELYEKGYRTYGCVCNTDKHGRRGLHWVAIFGDMRHDTWSIEFFNSTGNKYRAFLDYTEKAAQDLRDHYDNEVKAVMASSKMHQRSNSECGPYAVYYIWARLHDIPYDWFEKEYIPDKVMYEFRKTIFIEGKDE